MGKGIIFVLGVVVGASSATLLCNIFLKKKYAKRMSDCEDKVSSMEEYVNKLRFIHDQENKAKELGYISEEGSDIKDESNKNDKSIRFRGREGTTVDYTKFYESKQNALAEAEYPREEDDDDYISEYYENKRAEEASKAANSKQKPRIIRADEYDEYEFHDKVTLYFYAEDGTLATEDNEIIDDVDALIGDALTKYGFDKNDENVIYVRNLGRGTDYEIAKVFGGFND